MKNTKKYFVKNKKKLGNKERFLKKGGDYVSNVNEAFQYTHRSSQAMVNKNKFLERIEVGEYFDNLVEKDEREAVTPKENVGGGKSVIINTDSWEFMKGYGDGFTSDMDEAHFFDNEMAIRIATKSKKIMLIDPITFEAMKKDPETFAAAKSIYNELEDLGKKQKDCGECNIEEGFAISGFSGVLKEFFVVMGTLALFAIFITGLIAIILTGIKVIF